jgi:acyl-coenzyme A thioesterase PaaI-like protein
MLSILYHASTAASNKIVSLRSLSMRSRNLAFCNPRKSHFLTVVSLLSAALAVATAWTALPQPKQHPSATSPLWNDFQKVSECEGLPPTVARDANVATISKTVNDLPISMTKGQYELMIVPDRGKLETHVIYGSLLKSNCIERYDVYRARRTWPRGGSVDAADESIPDVVGIVTVGENLDGHSGIVHGGIIALIIDDVLGFGYYAVLMDELDSLGSKNSGVVDDYMDVVAVTANLNINFRAPLPSGSTFIVEATLVSDGNEFERRTNKNKFHWEVQVTTLDRSVIFCQATSLYVIPKQAPNVVR